MESNLLEIQVNCEERQLEKPLSESLSVDLRHEIDRAHVTLLTVRRSLADTLTTIQGSNVVR